MGHQWEGGHSQECADLQAYVAVRHLPCTPRSRTPSPTTSPQGPPLTHADTQPSTAIHVCPTHTPYLCVVVHTVCVGEDAAPGDHEPAAAAAVLPLALPGQAEVGLSVDAKHL